MMNEQIKSFVIRNGRCGVRQNLSYLYGLCHYGLTDQFAPWCFETIFGRQADTIVEIGFGMGQSLIEMAQNNPDKNYIGIEVHRPGIGQLLSEVLRLGLQNLRVVPFDAMLAFKKCIPAGSLAGIQIYFPDPWPKKRHHKRRLVQTAFVEVLAQALKPQGYLHCATDWAPYAEFMLEQIAPCQLLKNTSATQTYVERPVWRPVTKFERRGVGLGHEVFDLLYQRMDSHS
jgi:tRNA (guanine-N7-)-methyltransferase